MTKEEALDDLQEILDTMERMLSYADEQNIKVCAGLIEVLHNELFEAALQIKSSADRLLNIEMRNYVALTISKARQAMREVEFDF